MFNISNFLIVEALAGGRREGGGARLRAALPAALLPGPFGLVVAVALASRNRPVLPLPLPLLPAPVLGVPQQGPNFGARGQQMLGGLIGPAPSGQPPAGPAPLSPGVPGPQGGAVPSVPRGEPFFPSFLGYKARQARAVAELMRITIAEPDEETLERSRGVVKDQDPPPGVRWRDDMTTVNLVFGA